MKTIINLIAAFFLFLAMYSMLNNNDYDFGYAMLGIAFIVCIVGIIFFPGEDDDYGI